jgi:hypothetical protein
MESVKILRALWRLRIFVCLVAVVAVLAGWMLAYRLSFPPERRSNSVGVASANILIDTPRSQVIEVAPKGSDTLGARANVLANLMVDGEIKDAIGRRAGVAPTKLIAYTESADTPTPAVGAQSRVYKTRVALSSDMSELPIVKVETQAPDVRGAIRLANAAVAGLSDYLNSKAADETISNTQRLRVSPLGTAQGQEATRGPGRTIALVVTVFVFLAGCAALLIVAALIRGWRAATASEDGGSGEHDRADDPPDAGEPFEAPAEANRVERAGALRV